jgi:hypothetical protein
LESLEEVSGKLLPFFSSDSKLDNRASGMKWLDDFVFVVTGEDESAVANKLLSKRP